jgi:hypothetical protein
MLVAHGLHIRFGLSQCLSVVGAYRFEATQLEQTPLFGQLRGFTYRERLLPELPEALV